MDNPVGQSRFPKAFRGWSGLGRVVVLALWATIARGHSPATATAELEAALDRTVASGAPTVLLAVSPEDPLAPRLVASLGEQARKGGQGGAWNLAVADPRRNAAWLLAFNAREFPAVVIFGRSKQSSLAVLAVRQGIKTEADVSELVGSVLSTQSDPKLNRSNWSPDSPAPPTPTPQAMSPAPPPIPPQTSPAPQAPPAYLATAPAPAPILIQPASQPILFAPTPPPTVLASAQPMLLPTPSPITSGAPTWPGTTGVVVVSSPGFLDRMLGTLGESLAQRKQPRLLTQPAPVFTTAPISPAPWPAARAWPEPAAPAPPLASPQSGPAPQRRRWFASWR